MTPVRVRLGDRSYNVTFGALRGLASALGRLSFGGRKAFVVTAAPVARAGHVKKVVSTLKKAGLAPDVAQMPDGESKKNKPDRPSTKTLHRKQGGS